MKVSLFLISLFCVSTMAKHPSFMGVPITKTQEVIYNLTSPIYQMNKRSTYLTDREKQKRCEEDFLKQVIKWKDQAAITGTTLVKVGFMNKRFSREEILNMPSQHPHYRGPVRGTNVSSKVTYLLGRPGFPHTDSRCGRMIDELETKVVDIEGQKCRQTKLQFDYDDRFVYFQTFCEESNTVYVNFDLENKAYPDYLDRITENCIHCN